MDKQTPSSNKPHSANSAKSDKENTMSQNFDVRKDQVSKNENSKNQEQKDRMNMDDENASSDESDQEIDPESDVEVAERPTTEQWKVKMTSAKHQWTKLQQDELLATEGRSERISELVQRRYSVSKAEADKQVADFFSKH
ncbi:MAG: hypothetical protein QE278_12585 [Limnobacter sp.]|nr:hypothetical protein [Limnobacter sp.]